MTWSADVSYSGMACQILLYDGEYIRSSDTDFPSGSEIPLKGSGLLATLREKSGSFSETWTSDPIDVSAGVEEKVTLFFRIGDAWIGQWGKMRIDYFAVFIDAAVLVEEDFTDSVHMERTGTFGDYGYISEGDPWEIYTVRLIGTISPAWAQIVRNRGYIEVPPGWLRGWNRRKSHEINGSSAEALLTP